MLIFCIVLWCLLGLISWMIAMTETNKCLTIKDIIISIIVCWLGIVLSIIILFTVFGDKKIYKIKDYKD
jgi:hypothetical protein